MNDYELARKLRMYKQRAYLLVAGRVEKYDGDFINDFKGGRISNLPTRIKNSIEKFVTEEFTEELDPDPRLLMFA